jgi:ribulose-phosphate 3-epimerase
VSRRIRVIPAVLTDDPAKLVVMARQVEGFTGYVQLDIMDGRFVPSRSVTCQQAATASLQIPWEVHLMVEKPEQQLECFKQAGARKAIFHFEAMDSAGEVIALARRLGLEVGLAVNPETPVSAVLPLVKDVDSILFLAVHPGFYGARFLPEVLDKIAELRRARPDIEIGIDGGVKESNIELVAGSGVNDIYVGSAIFLDSQPADAFRRLEALANETA